MPFKNAKLKLNPKWPQYLQDRFKIDEAAYKKDAFLQIYAEIGTLLGSVATAYNLLTPLEAELKSRLGATAPALEKLRASIPGLKLGEVAGVDKLKAFKAEFERVRKGDDQHYYKFKSVLDSVLSNAETTAGFSTPVPTLGGIFTGDEFAKVLKQAMHFKDPGVSPSHGDFTHRIQWWLVYTCLDLPAEPKGLTWPKVFAALPTYTFQTKRQLDMWAFLFDYLPNEMQVGDRSDPGFNQPENMNDYIMGGPAYPVLKSMLTARFNKRLLMQKSFKPNDKIWTTAYPELKQGEGFTRYRSDDGIDIALALVPKARV